MICLRRERASSVDRLAIYCIVQKRNKSNNDASRKINDSRRYLMYLPQLVPSGSRVIRKLKTFSKSPHYPYMGVSASLDGELCRKVSMRGLVEEGAPTDFGQHFSTSRSQACLLLSIRINFIVKGLVICIGSDGPVIA
jgi:hypothetical protein